MVTNNITIVTACFKLSCRVLVYVQFSSNGWRLHQLVYNQLAIIYMRPISIANWHFSIINKSLFQFTITTACINNKNRLKLLRYLKRVLEIIPQIPHYKCSGSGLVWIVNTTIQWYHWLPFQISCWMYFVAGVKGSAVQLLPGVRMLCYVFCRCPYHTADYIMIHRLVYLLVANPNSSMLQKTAVNIQAPADINQHHCQLAHTHKHHKRNLWFLVVGDEHIQWLSVNIKHVWKGGNVVYFLRSGIVCKCSWEFFDTSLCIATRYTNSRLEWSFHLKFCEQHF